MILDYWTIVCLILCLFTLAESNMYGSVLPYYRIFHYSPSNPWSIEGISIPWRIGLFLYTFLSAGTQ
jgi:hypothetical protein